MILLMYNVRYVINISSDGRNRCWWLFRTVQWWRTTLLVHQLWGPFPWDPIFGISQGCSVIGGCYLLGCWDTESWRYSHPPDQWCCRHMDQDFLEVSIWDWVWNCTAPQIFQLPNSPWPCASGYHYSLTSLGPLDPTYWWRYESMFVAWSCCHWS